MKLSNTILALLAVQPLAAAFVLQAPGSAASTVHSESTLTSLHSVEPSQAGGNNAGWDAGQSSILVQGGSLRTWSTPIAERIQVLLKTDGRPLNANIELWHGPDNTPQKMNVYIEDGNERPFSCVVETPRGQNAIAIRNTAQIEFPLTAAVIDEVTNDPGLKEVMTKPPTDLKVIQGGALRTYTFVPTVASVAVLLKTDMRPLNARIELLQGPNNIKQIMEVYTEDGNERPFFVVIETPGSGNVVRIVNTAPVEFPLNASVEPYVVEPGHDETTARGWDNGGGTPFLPTPSQW